MSDEIKNKIAEIEAEMARPDFWQDKDKAQNIIKEYQDLKEELESPGGSKYDKLNAIVTIYSGAGGDDSEDFSRMLLEMYMKYAEKNGFQISFLDENANDHGGFRNVMFKVSGKKAYGVLKGESGVHRLVRISPFSAKDRRHTSFSMVEVIPEFPKEKTIDIPEDDLQVEFTRTGGPGGQNVNKRETTVRITHKPTGLIAQADSERTQEANRKKALTLLEGKLYRKREADRQKEAEGLAVSTTTDIEWGSQIRSYVLHPYKMVKDHRTGVETSEVDKVLAGELDEFIEAELELIKRDGS